MYVHAMMYEYGILLRCFLVWESKSQTAAEEYWEAESFISTGDDEWRRFAGDFLFLSEDILSGLTPLENKLCGGRCVIGRFCRCREINTVGE